MPTLEHQASPFVTPREDPTAQDVWNSGDRLQ
jgi:hypothetical protein